MKKSKILIALLTLTFCLFLPSSFAATRTWGGGGADNNWNTAANWGGTAPVNADLIVFSGTTQQNNTNNISNLSVNGLWFANNGFALNGNLMSLNGPLTNSAGVNILAQGVVVTVQNPTWNIAAGSEVRFAGPFTNTTTANPLATMGFGGTVRIGSTNCLLNRFFTLTSGSVIADGCVLTTLDGFRLQPPTGSNAVFQITNNASFTIVSGGNLRLCQTATGGSSRVDMSSGILNLAITSGLGAGDIFVGEAANTTTVFNQNGGLVEFTGNGNNRIAFANAAATANGTYNLNGGVLWTKQVTQVTPGSPGGTFNFNGGTLKPTASSTTFFQGVQTANIQAGGAFIDTTNLAITIGQSLAGGGPLVKLGTGTLTLSGANTYNGTTTVSNGTLALAPGAFNGGGAMVVAGGATLSLTNNGSSISVSSLTMGAASTNTVQFNFPGGNPGTATIVAGTLTGNGYAAIKISGSGFIAGTFPLINFTSASGLANFHLVSVPVGVSASLVTNSSSLQLNITSIGKSLAWSGAANNQWDTSSTNWFDLGNGNNPTNYAQSGGFGDIVTFDDSLSANPAINMALTVVPASMSVNNNSAVYSFTGSGKISGAGSITKDGFQPVTLGTANDYFGGTILNAGIIYAGADQALGSGAALLNLGTIASDSTTARTLSNPFTQNADAGIILGDTVNSGTLTLGGGLNLGGGGTRTLNLNSDVVLSGSLTNGGFTTKTGPGTLTIKGGNSFVTGLVSQQQGDVIVDGAQFTNNDGWRLQNTFSSTAIHLIVTNGGVLNIATGGNTGNLRVGLAGGDNSADNILDIYGTANLAPVSASVNGNNAVTLGLSGANDILYLRAGSLLITRSVFGASPGNTEAHFMGGTLRAIADDTGLIVGLTNAFMENGGLTIDTTNFSVTVPQALIASGSGGLSKTGAGTLTLTGADTYTGTTVVNAGKLILEPAHAAPGGISVATNATLSFLSTSPGVSVYVVGVTNASGATLEAQFAGITNNPTAPAGTITNLVLNGTVGVNLIASNIKIGQFPLFGYGTISGSGHLSASQLPQGVIGSLITNAGAQTIDLVVSSVTPLVWIGATNGNWDTTTTNWSLSGNGVSYHQSDNVRFDDSASNSTVNLTLALTPGAVTVSNRALSYQLGGSGSLGGSMALVKDGTNSLALNSANSFLGTVTINSGTVIAGNATALGTTNGATIVASGATLNTAGQNLGLEPVVVGGAGVGGLGALVSTGPDQNNSLRDVTLTADTVIRADALLGIRTSADDDPGFRGNGYKLTKVGGGQVNLNGGQTNPGATIWEADLGDVNILAGTISFQRRMTMGRPTNSVNVASNATLLLFALNTSMPLQVKPVNLTNATLSCNGNNATEGSAFGGPISLASGSNFMAALTGTTLRLLGPISGAGGLYVNSSAAGTVSLGGTNTYTGVTEVQTGMVTVESTGLIGATPRIQVDAGATLDVSAFSPWVLGANQALGGYGIINGTVLANGTVAPGTSIGALTFMSDLTLAGTNVMEVTKDGGLTNDVVNVNGVLTYGGVLKVVLTGSTPLAVNDTFKLFNFVSAPSGSFASIILPTGYTWDTTQLSPSGDGSIKVTGTSSRPHPGFTSVVISGGSVVLSGTNAVGTYVLYSSTNLSVPVVSWTPEATNSYSGAFSFTNSMNAARMFYLLQ